MKRNQRPRSVRRAVILWALALQVSIANADQDREADVLMLALPASAYWLTLHKDDDDGAWALTKSLALSAATTLALNAAIDDDAPNGKSGHAFPSGHATVAFASAGFMQRRYGWRAGIPAYLVAAYTGWLRLETDDHDTADVIGGAAVGVIASYLLTRPFAEHARASVWTDGESAHLQVQVRW